MLEVRALTLDYVAEGRRVRATDRVSFTLHEGERLVLLGPSGCGKSTLLKAVAGFLRPAGGQALLDGRRIEGPGPDRLVVFQEYDQLPPWKTVRQNVAFPLIASRQARKAEALARADAALAQVGLTSFADAYPHTLSGGMKQRVAIARALALRPRLLLMDEPFAALDALTRRRMQQELLALAEASGMSLLFVTHAIDEALIVGHRIVLLSAHPGRVRAELDVRALGPLTPGAADFQRAVDEVHAALLDEVSEGLAP